MWTGSTHSGEYHFKQAVAYRLGVNITPDLRFASLQACIDCQSEVFLSTAPLKRLNPSTAKFIYLAPYAERRGRLLDLPQSNG